MYDFTDTVSRPTGDALERTACALYRQTSVHMVHVVVDDPDAADIETYALRLFESWGIGDDRRQDGLLVLVDIHDGNGTARVEVGYGLEEVVNSLVARDAVQAGMDLRNAALEQGGTAADGLGAFLLGTSATLVEAVGAAQTHGAAASPVSDRNPLGPLMLIVGVVFGGGLYLYRDRFTRRHRNEWGDVEPTRWDHFFAGVTWREGRWEPDETHAGHAWFRRGRRFRYFAFLLIVLNVLLSLLSGRRRGGFGGGRSGGGGNTGRF